MTGGYREGTQRSCAGPSLDAPPTPGVATSPRAPPLGRVRFGGAASTKTQETVSPHPQTVSVVGDRRVWFSFASVTDRAPRGTISDTGPPGFTPSAPLTLGTVTPCLAMSPATHALLQAHDPSYPPFSPSRLVGFDLSMVLNKRLLI